MWYDESLLSINIFIKALLEKTHFECEELIISLVMQLVFSPFRLPPGASSELRDFYTRAAKSQYENPVAAQAQELQQQRGSSPMRASRDAQQVRSIESRARQEQAQLLQVQL